ncbi:hypothetical protein [Streptomyces sp. NPDC091212]|uniref:hypothetical protein n=1 Tax=Streptomyces sp. NPDC091212 TaxID=3155191 RepID=UPI00341DEF29
MPTPESNTLKSQYAEKVTADLERNTAEQERIRTEIASLEEQLSGLEQDHELLVGMRAALGGTATVPTPRGSGRKTGTRVRSTPAKAAGKKATVKTASATKSASASKSASAKKTSGAKSAPAGEKPRALGDLIHEHLSVDLEPRTAGEIARALTTAHPHRNISDNLVRTTTERLVARGQVERAKQGSTVYYTASTRDDSATTAAPADKEPASADA